MLLALDTATRMAGFALYDQKRGRVLGEETWYSANNQTVELMPRLVHLLDLQGVRPRDLSGLAVSLGPGSFTGLRIGLGIAKGLAAAAKLSLVGIPTLDALAHPQMLQRKPIVAVVQAGRKRICVARYVRHQGRWRRRGPYELTTLAKLCDQIEQKTRFCGELDAQDAEFVRGRVGDLASIASPAASLRRAAFIAELGWERLARGDADDAATLSPIYLHHPQIDG